MSDMLKSFLAGWCGGIGNLLVGHPFDTVKTIMQSDPVKYKSATQTVADIVKNEGPLAVYKGVKAPMAGVGTVFAIYFFAYDTTERALRWAKGYDNSRNLTLPEVMICGGSTGFFGSLILGPAELLKVQQQTATLKGADGSFGAVVKNLYREGGVLAFYRGFSATIARDMPGSMAWFGAYEMAKQSLCEDPKKPTVYQALVAGGCGGMGMWSIAIPMDAVKTRIQSARGESLGFGQAFRAILKERGPAGFYVGIGPALLRAFPANAATFAAKETAMGALDNVM